MKNDYSTLKSLLLWPFALVAFLGFSSASIAKTTLTTSKWSLTYDSKSNGVDIKKGKKLIYDDVYASYKFFNDTVCSNAYDAHSVLVTKISDNLGEGYCYQVRYTSYKYPTLVQSFYLYSGKDYVLTDFTLESKISISSNYMAPVNILHMPGVLNKGTRSRALFVPFDNDCWIRYQSLPLNFERMTSYEVTAIYNDENRDGLIVGSVEHNNWKSAVTIGKVNLDNVGSLVCYGGVADKTTRDSKAHGALVGTKIKSPKILLGFFDDWREGLEEYAQVNAVIAPPRAWNKAVPFGWNSWGALQFNLTYEKALEVSDFYKQYLQNHHFENSDHLVYIGLDSGWNKFSEKELKAFVDKCEANGQVAGIYWTPFTDWGKNPEHEIKEAPNYKYKDIYIYANGKPQELDGAYAIDPTHPAVEAMMKHTAELFHKAGFKYVKLDFMTHGSMEADKWYNPNIHTGIQAYNYGMKLLDKYFSDMYMNLSISPIFPANYAQSRRIACDAWNKMKDTEYTLNALSYGWWLDKVYQFNDPDHIVLRDATDGENRARVTSGVITGLFIAGDDFSQGGAQNVKEKAMKYLTNSDINHIANGLSFRPVNGNGEKSENQFIRIEKDGEIYFVVFNYKTEELKQIISLERLGLSSTKSYKVKELWSGKEFTAINKLNISVPALDVVVFKLRS